MGFHVVPSQKLFGSCRGPTRNICRDICILTFPVDSHPEQSSPAGETSVTCNSRCPRSHPFPNCTSSSDSYTCRKHRSVSNWHSWRCNFTIHEVWCCSSHAMLGTWATWDWKLRPLSKPWFFGAAHVNSVLLWPLQKVLTCRETDTLMILKLTICTVNIMMTNWSTSTGHSTC